MADFTITITVPDGKLNEFVRAVRWDLTGDPDGGINPDTDLIYTVAEMKAEISNGVRQSFKDIFKRFKDWEKEQVPVDDEIDITV